MIRYTTGDILRADAEAIVNTVNCVGIMGRGIALQFKNAFPVNFKAYEAACKRDEVQPGKMFVFETGTFTNPKYIINFPTKRHWRGKSRMEDIDSGLVALAEEIRRRGIRSIAIPPLGSGLGGLNWGDVRPRIEAALRDLSDLDVIVFEPNNAPVTTKSREVPAMSPGRAALVVLMNRYLGGLMDPFVTLLEVHKLMYFMQEAGEPLRLKYAKAPYGPYAENLRHVLRAVEGHLVSGYADGGDAPDKQLELVPGAVKDAESFLSDKQDTAARFDRVAELVEGFETPFGLELLATVHWVTTRENAASAEDAMAKVYAWNERKKRFSPRQIGIALQTLQNKGWLASA
ncbi:type II toxin-antitoxin system antitoxin DNA ADP-ribosyl glycohydrolase DarG [Paracoccus versutus]|uniref:O-acetyl-ADP-ribose deacetylase (Regulator of RNase III) n=2 Tax=Paracoccus versutus TaxID=34007 RepID=A0A3D9XT15_PARVE|nr:macro domain-containing protein [Paracoccus versutus]REF73580.1 O-acetyl-ADP-ribose deacetylase (regulator of RNase III) [Paracoccus versutus]WGR56494.1 Appr-1-p processing protein [Paracoccus versutus]